MPIPIAFAPVLPPPVKYVHQGADDTLKGGIYYSENINGDNRISCTYSGSYNYRIEGENYKTALTWKTTGSGYCPLYQESSWIIFNTTGYYTWRVQSTNPTTCKYTRFEAEPCYKENWKLPNPMWDWYLFCTRPVHETQFEAAVSDTGMKDRT